MVWVVIFPIAGVVYVVWESFYFARLPKKILFNLILVPIIAGAGLMVGLSVAFLLGLYGQAVLPTEIVIVSESPIYSLSGLCDDDTDDFVLLYDTVDSQSYIYYGAELQENTLTAAESKVERTMIVQSNTETPNVKTRGRRYKWKWVKLILIDFDHYDDTTILTVPIGTEVYSLDGAIRYTDELRPDVYDIRTAAPPGGFGVRGKIIMAFG